MSSLAKAYFYSISGYVYDENNQPLPYVNIFVKNTENYAQTDINGKYYIELKEGSYELIFKMLGYQDKVLKFAVTKNEVKNLWMQQSEKST